MGKILLNIFIIYMVWQFLKMFFAVKTVQKGFSEQMNDLNEKVNQQKQQHTQNTSSKKNKDDEGEYVDFEEIK